MDNENDRLLERISTCLHQCRIGRCNTRKTVTKRDQQDIASCMGQQGPRVQGHRCISTMGYQERKPTEYGMTHPGNKNDGQTTGDPWTHERNIQVNK